MSIINDALKKTEESIQKNSVAKETAKADKKQKLKPFLSYILIFIAGLLLTSLILAIIKHKNEPINLPEPLKTTPIEKESQTAKTLPAVSSPLPEEQPKPEKKFILSGIFFSANGAYALVNNQIVRENDLVDGAKVGKITVNNVELNNEGKIITLSTNR